MRRDGRNAQPRPRLAAVLCLIAVVGAAGWLVGRVSPASALPTTQPAEASPNGVHDEAKLFQPDSIRQAEDVIRQVKQDHMRDLLIETYPKIAGAPEGPGDEQARNRFYTDWIRQRGQALRVRGMMVVIVMDRPHLQVFVGSSTEKLFTRADQEELQEKLADALKQKHYDNGLVKTAEFVKERMDRNASP